MTMKVATVEILIEKAHFEPRVAVAVAEAMDEAIDAKSRETQPVTVPVFEARFAASEAKIDARFAASESKIDGRFAAFDAKIDARFVASESQIFYGAILSQFAVLLALAYFFVSHLK
jgi:hypothetical protein